MPKYLEVREQNPNKPSLSKRFINSIHFFSKLFFKLSLLSLRPFSCLSFHTVERRPWRRLGNKSSRVRGPVFPFTPRVFVPSAISHPFLFVFGFRTFEIGAVTSVPFSFAPKKKKTLSRKRDIFLTQNFAYDDFDATV
jgi:hypothetical protein